MKTKLQKIREHHENFRKQAEEMGNLLRDQKMPELTEEAFLVYEKTGNRIRYENDYFSRRRFLVVFGLLASWYHRKNDVEKLEEVIEEICQERTWALPAHVNRKEVGWERTVDLFACETGQAMALILSETKEYLSKVVVEKVKQEITFRLLDSYLERSKWSWESFHNNWAAVCGGCLGSIALFLLENEDKKQKAVLERVCGKVFPDYLNGMMEDGTCPEGLGYFTYGMTYFVGFARQLYEHTNGEVNLLNSKKVKKIACFQQKCFLPGGCTVSFSDAESNGHYRLGLTCFLAELFEGIEIPDVDRALEFERDNSCFWANWQDDVWVKEYLKFAEEKEDVLEWFCLLPDAQWAIWKNGKLGMALKGGNNGESHNHNDIGSFLIAADGEVFLADLGAGEYTKDYFTKEKRYHILCNRSSGHSVPIINGQEQRAGADYASSAFLCERPGCVEVEFAGAYEKQPSWKLSRRIENEKNEEKITITDWLEGDGIWSLEENLVTQIEPKIMSRKILLAGRKGTMTLALPENCDDVHVLKEIFHNHQGKDEDVWMIRFSVPIKNGRGQCEMACFYDR